MSASGDTDGQGAALSQTERERLRRRLIERGATPEQVADRLHVFEERARVKRELMVHRRFSNATAEGFLDRSGFPRPPGWHAVLFHPGSYRPRGVVLLTAVVMLLALGAVLR